MKKTPKSQKTTKIDEQNTQITKKTNPYDILNNVILKQK